MFYRNTAMKNDGIFVKQTADVHGKMCPNFSVWWLIHSTLKCLTDIYGGKGTTSDVLWLIYIALIPMCTRVGQVGIFLHSDCPVMLNSTRGW